MLAGEASRLAATAAPTATAATSTALTPLPSSASEDSEVAWEAVVVVVEGGPWQTGTASPARPGAEKVLLLPVLRRSAPGEGCSSFAFLAWRL